MVGMPSRDWTRPYGVQRPQLPPDDECTDLAAWLAGRFDSPAADEFCLSGGGQAAEPTRTETVGSATTEQP